MRSRVPSVRRGPWASLCPGRPAAAAFLAVGGSARRLAGRGADTTVGRIVTALAAAIVVGASVAAAPAWADGGRRLLPPPSPERDLYRSECGACHVAFPPALLPAASWQAVLGGLDRHYGSDASLDGAARDRLAAWLPAQAERSRLRERPPEDRLTRSPWFVREHREARDEGGWRPAGTGAAATSFARCEACHVHASEGAFDEHDLRRPR